MTTLTAPLGDHSPVAAPALRPVSAIPATIAEEWVSASYVLAIAAQAGLNISNTKWDDGIDLSIGSTKPVIAGYHVRNLWISLQLKATENWVVKDDHISFFLKRSNYEQLKALSLNRQYLVLYTLPKDKSRSRWIEQHPAHIQFSSRAFYLDLLGAAEIVQRANGRHRTGKTVKIPVANRLTACSLLKIYLGAAEWAKRLLQP